MSAFWCTPCWHQEDASQDEVSEEEEAEPPARTQGNGVTFRVPAGGQQEAAARNQRDLGRLREAFPGHCCHNLLYGFVLQRGRACTNQVVQGWTQDDADEIGCVTGGKFRNHAIPDEMEDLVLESRPR